MIKLFRHEYEKPIETSFGFECWTPEGVKVNEGDGFDSEEEILEWLEDNRKAVADGVVAREY